MKVIVLVVMIVCMCGTCLAGSITLSYPDDQQERIITALCDAWNYNTRKLDGETRAQFIKRFLAQSVKAAVHDQEVKTKEDAQKVIITQTTDYTGIE